LASLDRRKNNPSRISKDGQEKSTGLRPNGNRLKLAMIITTPTRTRITPRMALLLLLSPSIIMIISMITRTNLLEYYNFMKKESVKCRNLSVKIPG
jgi:hypothetical protein